VKVLSIPSAEQNYLVFNTGNSANPLLNNPAFWEAARWLVDYDGITKNLLKGQYFVHQSFLPVGLPGALEDNPFKFDPAKAKRSSPKRALRMRTSRWTWRTNRRLSPSPSRCRPALPRAA
jgi:peptide/nickel transport system substrate-binding protein